ncbi:MAG: OmpA/MotB family protein [Lewinella sp.]|jgi:chemotaxis protein MotB|uniref:OmpA/MotB family protein n=1 Tax=Lewinella sp. TaxID=2004506 RepID=UPI003D6B1118
MKKYMYLLFLGVVLSSCVSKKKFQASEQHYQQTADSLQRVNTTKITQLKDSLSFERGANYALSVTQDKLQDRLDILQLEIDNLGSNASSTQQELNNRLRQKDELIAERQAKIDAVNRILRTRQERLVALSEAIPGVFSAQEITEGWEILPRNGQLVLAINEDNLFRRGSTSSLTSTGEETLNRIAAIVVKYPEMLIQVIGHTDNVPVPRESLDNWQYSALRAVSVLKGLTASGDIGPNRIIAASKSEYEPLGSNETTEGRQRNRRVELIIAPRESDLEREVRRIVE